MSKNKLNRAISKIGRELLCFGEEACNCLHSEKSHQNIERFGTVCTGSTGPTFNLVCICKEYHPKDNLVYLEYKSKELKRK